MGGSPTYSWMPITWNDCKLVSLNVRKSYLDSIINILSNLPKTLVSFELKPPKYRCIGNGTHIVEAETIKLVKQICDMTMNVSGSDLERITLNGLRLSSKAKNFL